MQYLISFMIEERLTQISSGDLGMVIKDGYLMLKDTVLPSPFLFQGNRILVRANYEDYIAMDGGKPLVEDGDLVEGKVFQLVHKMTGVSYGIMLQRRETLLVKHSFFRLSGNVLIGRGANAQICCTQNQAISSEHAMLKQVKKSYVLEDISKKAGIYVNGTKQHSRQLQSGDVIWCMGMTIVFMGDYIGLSANANSSLIPCNPPVAPLTSDTGKEGTFQRSPRIIRSLETGVHEIDPPTQKQVMKSVPLLLSIGPSLTMSMAMMVSLGVAVLNASNGGSTATVITSGAMAVSMLSGAILWPSMMKKHQRKELAQLEDLRQEKYADYIQENSQILDKRYKRNHEIWNEHLAPSSEKVALYPKSYAQDGNHLWERKPSDPDFLSFRIGVGEHPFEVDIKVPKVGFSLDDDELRSYPKRVQRQYRTLKDVPVVLSLKREKLVGIFGHQEGRYQLLQSLMLQTMSHYSPEEVKTVFLFSEHERDKFLWAKELPSVWSNDRSIRFMATNEDEAHQVLTYVDEKLSLEEPSEVYVFFITNKALLEREKLGQILQSPHSKLPVYSVFLSDKISGLPKTTNAIIRMFPDKLGFYSKSQEENIFVACKPEAFHPLLFTTFRDNLRKVPLTLESNQLGIPERVGFLEMYRAGNLESLRIEEKWLNNRSHKSLATPIGLSTGSEVFSLDIHESYHGCHGLVAGTTGSGKTEFLQEFILSLMVNYSPNEVNFVLVDFKGGDMARPFLKSTRGVGNNAPHVAATITNLSTNMLYRALTSLKAEIQYRQKVFNQAAGQLDIDKIDINAYQQYMKEGKLSLPLPHLVVVIDEFAQLKTQFPDFLQELINVAQVGRSLGIHLILATQKPSGVVDPQIWSNSRFRVCLKVSDKQDSSEMINTPQAASIKQPGRCFVQVGYDELFVEVQTGYSGCEYVRTEKFMNSDDLTVDLVDYSANKITSKKIKSGQEKTERSQIEAVVAELKEVGRKYQYQTRQLWSPLLTKKLALTQITDTVGKHEVILGVVDDIRNQKQYSYTLDFQKMEHVLIYGMSGQGKSTLLQSILYQMLSKHSKSAYQAYIFDFAGPSLRYFQKIDQVAGYTDVGDEYEIQEMLNQLTDEIARRKALFQEEDCTSFAEYSKKHPIPQILLVIDNYAPWNDRYYKFQDTLREILNNSLSAGITFLVSNNSKSGIPSKMSEHFRKLILFKMPDKSDYRDLFRVQVPVVPEDVVGRCLVSVGKDICELQTALIIPSETEAERVQHIVKTLPAKTAGGISGRREVPVAKPAVTAVPQSPSAPAMQIRRIALEQLNFAEGMFVSGTDPVDVHQSTLTLALQHPPDMIFSAHKDFQSVGVPVVWGEEEIDEILEEVVERVRNRKTTPCPVITIHIPSFSEFFAIVSDEKLVVMEVLLKQHGDLIKVVTGDSVQKLNPYTSTEFYTLAVKQPQGIITNPQDITSQMSYLHSALVPPVVNPGFRFYLYYHGEQWNALQMGG